MAPTRLKFLAPSAITLLVCTGYVVLRLARSDWDPAALAEPGTRYSDGVAGGTEGYDGQFALAIALEPNPELVAPKLDVPPYRYQRILYPLLARVLAGGSEAWIPWTMILVGLLAQLFGTLVVCSLIDSHGQPAGYGLAYGLWAGLVAAVGLDLNEPLAYALVAAAWWARRQNKDTLGAVLIGLALFAKETSLIFWAAWILAEALSRADRRRAATWALAAVPFAIWQLWLWQVFGSPGLASGGALATPFEWVPYLGLLRIGTVHLGVLALYLVIFGPTIVLPSIWGAISSVARLREGDRSIEVMALLAHSGFIALLPFSTYREPLALLRVGTGLVLAVLIYASRYGMRRPLNYSLLWIVLLAILIRD